MKNGKTPTNKFVIDLWLKLFLNFEKLHQIQYMML
jgi:hypothetical protein